MRACQAAEAKRVAHKDSLDAAQAAMNQANTEMRQHQTRAQALQRQKLNAERRLRYILEEGDPRERAPELRAKARELEDEVMAQLRSFLE